MTPAKLVPRYDTAGVRPSVVHLGLGGFHRAHQAAYSDDLLAGGSTRGGICAVSLRSTALQQALAAQDHLYCLLERSTTADQVRVIGSIRRTVAAATHGSRAVLAALTDPEVDVVTLTVTEKGYCSEGTSGDLDINRTEIRQDLIHPGVPRSVPGLLLEAIVQRRLAGIPPFTVSSCDNLPGNGVTTRRVVTGMATLRDERLADWIAANVAFPSSMVDRMAPAPTEQVRQRTRELTGVDDTCAMATEPFSAWVLEDCFPWGRPAWEEVGVQLVDDVSPFERAKLRLLNGAHSALAYLGLLAGHTEVASAVGDHALSTFVRAMLMHEVLPTLEQPDVQLATYVDEVLGRFANARLPYATRQVAGDGSQKLPGRILGSARDQLAAGRDADRLATVVASFAACTLGPRAPEFALTDPALDRLLGGARPTGLDAATAVERLLALVPVFGPDLPRDPAFRAVVLEQAELLWRGDLTSALARFVA